MKKIIATAVKADEERLRNIPHRYCGNVALVYRFVSAFGVMSRVITEEDCMEYGFTESQLYAISVVNGGNLTPRIEELGDGLFECRQTVDVSAMFTGKALDGILRRTGAKKLFLGFVDGVLRISTEVYSIIGFTGGAYMSYDHLHGIRA